MHRHVAGLTALILFSSLTGCTMMTESRLLKERKGKPAPEFSLRSIEGRTVRLSDYAGKPVVLAFFAVGCGPCRMEAPHLSSLAEKRKDVAVLAVNAWDETAQTVSGFARDNNLQHTILLDGSDVADRYGVTSLPTTFWIDRQGRIADAAVGYDGPRELERATKAVVGDSG